MSLLDPIKPYLSLIKTGLFVACVAAAFVYGCSEGREKGEDAVRGSELKRAQDAAQAEKGRADAEKARADRFEQRALAQEAVAQQYLEALGNANRKGDQLAADLIAGRQRFNRLWSQCQAVPAAGDASAGSGSADAAADDRAASAGRIVRAAAACDAQVKGLQAILIQERQAP